MKNYIPVEGNLHLVRDKSTGAILNINKGGLYAARQKKIAESEAKKETENLKSEIAELKQLIQNLSKSE
jgi:hypothetical protein